MSRSYHHLTGNRGHRETLPMNATGTQSRTFRLWDSLLDKQPSFLSKIKKKERWNAYMWEEGVGFTD